jgi:predicted acyl esterase
MGGALLNMYMLSWASSMLVRNAQPPQPHIVGERWREMWLERMEQTPPFVEAWVGHQRRDEFWKQGSVCENYADITCAVYAIGGWADGYRNTVFRLLEGLQCPKKGLVGPWSHIYPHFGQPGPLIGFLQESLRWWDYWLKGIDTGVMDEPPLRTWVQESVPPRTHYAEWPGRWVAEPSWPSPNIERTIYYLTGSTGLTESPADGATLTVRSPLATGIYAGTWCPFGLPGDWPADQRDEDGQSICFDTAPLSEPMDILGFPELTLTLSSDKPNALVAVRLCDVAPEGASLLVTRGMLNLTHRDSHEFPEPLEPGRPYTVTVRLNSIAHSLPAGHRWRVAVSSNYWTHLWPSPDQASLSLLTGEGCRLMLPTRLPRTEDADLPEFGPAEGSAPLKTEMLRSGGRTLKIDRDLVTGRIQITDRSESGLVRHVASGIEHGSVTQDEHSILEGDPLSIITRCSRAITINRGDWRTRVETVSAMTADAANFHLTNALEAYEGDVRVFAKTWHRSIPRDLV